MRDAIIRLRRLKFLPVPSCSRLSIVIIAVAVAIRKFTKGRKPMIRSKNSLWLAAALVSGFVALPGYARAAGGADAAGIRAQTTNWVKAYNVGDAKAVTALYAEDAILLPPGAPGAKGRAAILAFITKDIASAKAAGAVFNVDPKTDIGVSGNMGHNGVGLTFHT